MNEIEVIDAEIVTAKGKNEMIEFYASHYADSVQTESFCCLYQKGTEAGSYSASTWFSLKTSSFRKNPNGFATEIIVSAPLWLLERKKIINLITKI